MATTVAALSIELSRRLADEVSAGTTDGERFTSNQRLAALDAAYNQMVLAVLGHTNARKSAYQLLGELSQREAQSILASGFSLDNFTYNVAASGIINVECEIDGARVFAVERELDDLQYAGNFHFKGNDGRPVFYILSNLLMLEVSLGSYPVSSWVHYIRQPKALSYTLNDANNTTSLETNGSLDEIILNAAISVAQQMSDDPEKVSMMNEISGALIQAAVAHEFGKSNKRLKGDA